MSAGEKAAASIFIVLALGTLFPALRARWPRQWREADGRTRRPETPRRLLFRDATAALMTRERPGRIVNVASRRGVNGASSVVFVQLDCNDSTSCWHQRCGRPAQRL